MTTTSTTRTFAIDPAHSTAEFVVRHMMIAKVRGRFTGLSGTIQIPEGSQVPTAIEATMETATVTTGEPQRDGHLRSADFFDAETHAGITFRSTAITGSAGGFSITGDLTIHGVTRPITLDASFTGEGKDPWGNTRYGYEAEGKLNRKDFGLNWNQALETGGVLVSDEVKVELQVSAIRQ